jgi:hypothetical protein
MIPQLEMPGNLMQADAQFSNSLLASDSRSRVFRDYVVVESVEMRMVGKVLIYRFPLPSPLHAMATICYYRICCRRWRRHGVYKHHHRAVAYFVSILFLALTWFRA